MLNALHTPFAEEGRGFRPAGFREVPMVGQMEKPEVDFTSDPPLSRTDIVSLLAIGVTTQNTASYGTGLGTTSGGGSTAAIASTPDPVPTSSTLRSRTSTSWSAARHRRVVA